MKKIKQQNSNKKSVKIAAVLSLTYGFFRYFGLPRSRFDTYYDPIPIFYAALISLIWFAIIFSSLRILRKLKGKSSLIVSIAILGGIFVATVADFLLIELL